MSALPHTGAYVRQVNSGDKVWLESTLPALRAMRAYLASRGLRIGSGGDPVVFTSPASGLADGGRHASNWYDIIEFGHWDAYLAVHGVWAMDCLAKLFAFVGDEEAAREARLVHAAAVSDFNALFWNATANA